VDEHIFDTIGDRDVAVCINVADISGEQPAVDDRFVGLVLLIKISAHDVVSTDDDLAGFSGGHFVEVLVDDAQLHVWNCASGGGGDQFRRIALSAHGGHTAGFGQAVGGEDGLEL